MSMNFLNTLHFGDNGGYGEECENISPPILYTELNQVSYKMENLMNICGIFLLSMNYRLWHPIRIASMRRF